MSEHHGISRRTALGVLAGAAAGTALSGGSPFAPAFAAKTLTVGFIYVGPRDDFGYNQAHAEAAAMLRKMSGVKVVEEEKVAETSDVQKTMESMINLDGASLVFPTSFGYFDPHMLKVAQKYPDVEFRHCGGMFKAGVTPAIPAAISAISTRANTSTASPPAMPPSRRSWVSSPPSRSPRCCATSTLSLWARGRSIRHHHTGDIHRRLVDAGQGSGSGERAGRCRRRCHHLPRRQPQGGRGNRRAARDLHLRLPRQSGRRSRPRAT